MIFTSSDGILLVLSVPFVTSGIYLLLVRVRLAHAKLAMETMIIVVVAAAHFLIIVAGYGSGVGCRM